MTTGLFDNTDRRLVAVRGGLLGLFAFAILVAVVRSHAGDSTEDGVEWSTVLKVLEIAIPAIWLTTMATGALLRLTRPLVIASAGLGFTAMTFLIAACANLFLPAVVRPFTAFVLIPVGMIIAYARVAAHVVVGPSHPAYLDA